MKYLKTHSERFWVLLPSFFVFFFGKGCILKWVDGLRNQTPTRIWTWMWWIDVIQGKRTKVPCFPYSPTFHGDYDSDKKCDWLVKELTLQQRTGLQAALVCTITKRCSLGNYSMPKQANYETQCNSGKAQSQQCDHSPKLTGWHNSALWFARFSVRSHSLWFNERVMRRRGEGEGREGGQSTTKKTWVKSVTINSS